MVSMKYTRLITATLMLTCACTPAPPVNESRDKLWDQFAHKSVDDVIMKWGAPGSETKLTNGSRLLTYRRDSVYDADTTNSRTSGCEVSFLAPPPHYHIDNIKMDGNGYECARLSKEGRHGCVI